MVIEIPILNRDWDSKLKVVQTIKNMFNLSLIEAKDMVDSCCLKIDIPSIEYFYKIATTLKESCNLDLAVPPEIIPTKTEEKLEKINNICLNLMKTVVDEYCTLHDVVIVSKLEYDELCKTKDSINAISLICNKYNKSNE